MALATRNGDLELLPIELVEHILSLADTLCLVRCRQVCKLLLEVIDHSSAAKYVLELHRHGLQHHHHPGPIVSAERLDGIHNYVDAWGQMPKMIETKFALLDGGLWELFGNVLAQSDPGKHNLHFIRLPSPSLGVEEHSWKVSTDDTKLRDFGIDPSQDLLLLIEPSRLDYSLNVYHLHLRSLTTGRPHSVAKDARISLQLPTVDTNRSYSIQISGDHIGVFFHNQHDEGGYLVVLNWKTGTTEMHIESDEMSSFAFLDEDHVIISPGVGIHLALTIIDFKSTSNEVQNLAGLTHLCHLSLPPFKTLVLTHVRCDASPAWPNVDSSVPFYDHPDQLLYTVSFWAAGMRNWLLVMTRSTLLAQLHRIGIQHVPVPWEDWGPAGTRLLDSRLQSSPSHTWSCNTFGSQLVAFDLEKKHINCFDFNQTRVKDEIRKGNPPDINPNMYFHFPVDETGVCTSPSVQRANVYKNIVETSLPFRARSIPIDLRDTRMTAVMCSQSHIIIVETESPSTRWFRVLAF